MSTKEQYGIREGVEIRDSNNRNRDWSVSDAYQVGYLSIVQFITDNIKELQSKEYMDDINRIIKNKKNIESIDDMQSIYLHKNKKITGDEKEQKEWSVYDQKESYSCIGYAITDMVYWHLVVDRYHNPKDRLSVRFNWMAAKELDEYRSCPTTFIEKEGSTLKAGLDICRKYGSVLDDMLPMDIDKMKRNNSVLYSGDTNAFYATAAKLRIESYYNLMTPQEYQIEIWKSWMLEHGPILVRVKVDSNFRNAGRETLLEFDEDSQYSKHAALLVGYEKDKFILRNSWGEEWGDNGYAYISFDYALKAFDEAYGVTFQGEYSSFRHQLVGEIRDNLLSSRPENASGFFEKMRRFFTGGS